ncbi:MAG: fibronectin type III domain-containing protein [Bacteroidales bacterium]|nr:fibronectin type III domain-containing protein [Bacteroidales bacterium]
MRQAISSWILRALMVVALAAGVPVTAGAADYIKDVMVIGGNSTEVNNLKNNLTPQGWTVIEQDLNAGASGDYIFLLYKSETSAHNIDWHYITDFYISDATGTIPDEITDSNGRTYHLVTFQGGNDFITSKGDLNRGAGGSTIHLYYTRDAFPDNRTVSAIEIKTGKDNKTGAVVWNGNGEPADLNKGCGSGSAYIYLHRTTGTSLPLLSGEGTAETPYLIGSDSDWVRFTQMIQDVQCTAQNFKLTANINVTTMAGTESMPFLGTFDGGGKTLNVSITSTDLYAAPFHYIKGATIRDLVVTGAVTSNNKHAAGLVGLTLETCTVSGCAVSTNVSAPTYAGGIVGHGGTSTLGITDSYYGGTIRDFVNHAGGLLGWCDDMTLHLNNCLFKGSFLPATSGSATGLYHPVACKWQNRTVACTASYVFYVKDITPTATGNFVIPKAEGIPVSTSRVTDTWDLPVTAVDGNTYYMYISGLRLQEPYRYGFENQDLYAEGWSTLDCVSSNIGIYPRPNQWSYQHEGDYAFRLCTLNTYKDQILVSPEFDGRNTITMSFWKRSYPHIGEYYSLGYSTTTNDIDAFEWDNKQAIQTVAWSQREAQFPKGTKYIAIKCYYHEVYRDDTVWLDDFVFSACHAPQPVNLAVSNITYQSATLSWDKPESENPITGYVYQYRPYWLDPNGPGPAWSSEVSLNGGTNTSVTLDGLDAGARYEFRVKALTGEGQESIYTSCQFTTNPTPKQLPYEQGFENGMDEWTVAENNYGHTEIKAEAAHEGEYGYAFWTRVGGGVQYLISPQFYGTEAMTVSFYYKNISTGYEEKFRVGYSTTTNNVSAFTWGDEISIVNPVWTQYEETFPVGTQYIAIQYTSNTHKLYLDDFVFVPYSPYAKPTGLSASNLTDHSAKVSWTKPDNSVSGYAYQYKETTAASWSGIATVSDESVTLGNLSANTYYDFRVQALYGEGNASSFVSFRLLTEGPEESVPHYQGFEDGMGGWRVITEIPDTGIYSSNSDNIHDGSHSFVFSVNGSSQVQYLISPLLALPHPELRLSLYYNNFKDETNSYLAKFQVGYTTNATKDINNFLSWSSEFTSSSQWKACTFRIPANARYVAIKWTRSFNLYVDDISLVPWEDQIVATKASFYGADKYLATFYSKPVCYELPKGAVAYTVIDDGGELVFVRIGDGESRQIPADTPVIIVADKETSDGDTKSLSLGMLISAEAAARSGNILQASDNPVTVTEGKIGDKTVYVLGVKSGVPGFYLFEGSEIPAGKVYILK